MKNARDLLHEHGGVVAALLLSIFHFTSFNAGTQPIVTDVRFFLYFAWQVAEGAVPHLDYFENKSQLASFVGALFYRVGELVRVDPLMAIRWGYLAITACGGMAAFFIHRRLGGGRAAAGGLGLLAFCSFGLLGVLPAVGNIPKLIMAVAASFAALLLYRRSWFWAGVAGAVAFMDWQIGGLVGLGAVVTAALHGSPRVRAVARVIAGGVAGIAPFLLYYAYHGALTETVRQVIGASLLRGSATLAQRGLSDRLDKIGQVVDLACPSQQWLFYLSVTGVLVTGWWLWRRRGDDSQRLLVPLAIYHGGVVAFSLVDFQYYGDFFLLLHSTAFFLGIAAVAAWVGFESHVPKQRRVIAAGVVLVVAFACARPGPLRPRFELVTPIAQPGATLDDQLEVARELDARIGDGRVAFMQHAEMFFLMRRENTLPLAYWNLPAWSHFRRSPEEPLAAACARMLLSTGADALVPPKMLGYDPLLRSGYVLVPLESANGRYSVRVALRSRDSTPAR